jgi:hypothetical protein
MKSGRFLILVKGEEERKQRRKGERNDKYRR